MHSLSNFQNQFLIAMPQQQDRHFNQALIYICQHNEEGAMGLIVNKPLPIDLRTLTKHLGLETSSTSNPNKKTFRQSVFYGGPCQSNHGFILHTGGLSWSSSIPVNEEIILTSSKEILSDIAKLQGPEHYLLALGYAGWSAGQLENEMANNVWLNVDYDNHLIFDMEPDLRWQQAAASIGVNIHLLGTDFGRA
jgi:putative transcriptional regulator